MCGGQWIQQVTLGWLLYDLTGSSVLLGLLNGPRAVPFLIASPIAGVAADRSFARARDEHLCLGPRVDARGCAYGGSQRSPDRRAGDRKLHGISGYSTGDSGRVAGARGA